MKSVPSVVLLLVLFGGILTSGRSIEEKRLIKTSEEDPGRWLNEEEMFELIRQRIHFVDVTDLEEAFTGKIDAKAVPESPRFQETVHQIIGLINPNRVEQFLRDFSSYHTRYYTSQTGRAAQLWLLDEVTASVQGYPGTAEVFEVDHGWLQQSIVARLEGTDPTLKSEVVVIGGHIDSVNRRGNTLVAPGSDDNASGAVGVLEALRNIVEAGVTFKRTLEFHWYAAEEVGLRGSQAIAQAYRRDSVNVVGMLNLDILAYYSGNHEIGIYTDYANDALAQFMRVLIAEYLEWGYRDLICGYGCSDHASFHNAGFPAVFIAEPVDHPGMHTETDNMDNVHFVQLHEFNKLIAAYAVEFGEPSD